MGDNGIDPYGSSEFTYGIIVVAAVLHLFIIFIVFYAICKNNGCQCCVIHRHDNNITAVVVAQRNPGSTLRSTSGSLTNLIGNTTSRTGLNRQTSLLGNDRTNNCDDTEGLPPPYEETGERSHGAINEGFISVELPSYEEYTMVDHPQNTMMSFIILMKSEKTLQCRNEILTLDVHPSQHSVGPPSACHPNDV